MNVLPVPPSPNPTAPCPTYSQLHIVHEENIHVDWCYMKGAPRQCFTPTMLEELQHYGNHLSLQADRNVRYMVQASDVPGIFNYGGDMGYFRDLIRNRDKAGLHSYARSCINAVYGGVVHFHRDITSIALVQGDALGGGLECALACDVLIAERQVRMGFPEILFNLFPGMGAYNLLSLKIGPSKAERVILSGKLYSGEEMFEMGIVDVISEPGEGEKTVYDYIHRENKFRNGFHAVRDVKKAMHPVSYEELLQVAEIWVEAALNLEDRNLMMMERLVTRQSLKTVD